MLLCFNIKGNAYKTSYMLKRNDITRKVSFESFSVLGTKTLKRMESSLYGNRKEHYQKRVFFSVFSFLRIKILKKNKTHTHTRIENTLHVETEKQNITKNRYFECFLSCYLQKTTKCIQRT